MQFEGKKSERVSAALKYRKNFNIHKYTIRKKSNLFVSSVKLQVKLIKAIEEKKFR